jgi:hypothetical protein
MIGVIMLISDKIDFKTKVTRGKEGRFIMVKVLIH